VFATETTGNSISPAAAKLLIDALLADQEMTSLHLLGNPIGHDNVVAIAALIKSGQCALQVVDDLPVRAIALCDEQLRSLDMGLLTDTRVAFLFEMLAGHASVTSLTGALSNELSTLDQCVQADTRAEHLPPWVCSGAQLLGAMFDRMPALTSLTLSVPENPAALERIFQAVQRSGTLQALHLQNYGATVWNKPETVALALMLRHNVSLTKLEPDDQAFMALAYPPVLDKVMDAFHVCLVNANSSTLYVSRAP
jgi:hypothetical protein